MTDYYTLKGEVPLQPGQTLGFTSGKGYYAAGTPTPTQATKETTAAALSEERPVATSTQLQSVPPSAAQVAKNTTGYPNPTQPTPAEQTATLDIGDQVSKNTTGYPNPTQPTPARQAPPTPSAGQVARRASSDAASPGGYAGVSVPGPRAPAVGAGGMSHAPHLVMGPNEAPGNLPTLTFGADTVVSQGSKEYTLGYIPIVGTLVVGKLTTSASAQLMIPSALRPPLQVSYAPPSEHNGVGTVTLDSGNITLQDSALSQLATKLRPDSGALVQQAMERGTASKTVHDSIVPPSVTISGKPVSVSVGGITLTVTPGVDDKGFPYIDETTSATTSVPITPVLGGQVFSSDTEMTVVYSITFRVTYAPGLPEARPHQTLPPEDVWVPALTAAATAVLGLRLPTVLVGQSRPLAE